MSERRSATVVVGGAGFLGRRLVSLLSGEAPAGGRPAGWPPADTPRVLDPAATDPSARGDVLVRDDLRRAFEGARTVFHLASVVDVSLRPHPRIERVNVEGAANVVEIAREQGVERVIYTSSEDVVLDRDPVRGGDELIPYPTRPIHDYVRTKIEGERVVLAADGRALRTVALRPVHIYGPDDPHAIPTSLKAFAGGTVPFRLGDGSARFDVVYVDNVAHAHLLAAEVLRHTPDRVGGKAYFVGEDNALNYFDFLEPYARAAGVTVPARRLPFWATAALATLLEGGQRLTGLEAPFHRFHLRVIGQDFFFSHRRAREDLGYAPLVSPAEGERRTAAWVRAWAEGALRAG